MKNCEFGFASRLCKGVFPLVQMHLRRSTTYTFNRKAQNLAGEKDGKGGTASGGGGRCLILAFSCSFDWASSVMELKQKKRKFKTPFRTSTAKTQTPSSAPSLLPEGCHTQMRRETRGQRQRWGRKSRPGSMSSSSGLGPHQQRRRSFVARHRPRPSQRARRPLRPSRWLPHARAGAGVVVSRTNRERKGESEGFTSFLSLYFTFRSSKGSGGKS